MFIKKLKIRNFRKFKDKEISFKKKWSILAAPNASGKSTIVEAIYMLSHGDSPWTSNNSNLIRNKEEISDHFRIEADVESKEESKNISVFVQKNGKSISKKFQIDGDSASKKSFSESLHCVLFSPDLIDFLMFEPKQRRDFLDSNIAYFDLYYSDLLSKYNRILRQRNSLLKVLGKRLFNGNGSNSNSTELPDKKNLNFWTDQIIEIGTKIMETRIGFIEKVNKIKNDVYKTKINYLPKVNLDDMAELASNSYISESFRKQMSLREKKDLILGVTTVGPHRDDWYLSSIELDNINTFGSRGEKRMAIADIIFKINLFFKESMGEKPVILLDDISSELDNSNLKNIFDNKIDKDQQVLITTTHVESIPQKARKLADVITL